LHGVQQRFLPAAARTPAKPFTRKVLHLTNQSCLCEPISRRRRASSSPTNRRNSVAAFCSDFFQLTRITPKRGLDNYCQFAFFLEKIAENRKSDDGLLFFGRPRTSRAEVSGALNRMTPVVFCAGLPGKEKHKLTEGKGNEKTRAEERR
jgi:hypothetical protein